MSGASAQLGDILHSDHVVLTPNGAVEWQCNPLECTRCDRQFTDPVTLAVCAHTFCAKCVQLTDGCIRCPLCGVSSQGSNTGDEPSGSTSSSSDALVKFLVATVNERSTLCANCDRVSTPMYFCETCQQALCNDCKTGTHQARMFASHRIVNVEERAVLHSNDTCADHAQPYILFCTDQKQLKCIKCFRDAQLDTRQSYVDLEKAHKFGCDKLNRVSTKLKKAQEDMNERIAGSRRFLDDLDGNCTAQRAHIQKTCQQMVDCLMQVRDRLIDALDAERTQKQQVVSSELRQLYSSLPTLQLYLLSASVLSSSASVIDFLTLSHDLMRRMAGLTAELQSASVSRADCGLQQVQCKDEFARALEPHLGISSILLPAMPPDQDQLNGSGHKRRRHKNGSGYVNCPSGWQPVSNKYQMMIDLAGAFGEEFDKINGPIESYTQWLGELSRRAQDMQRDMTVRRVIIAQHKVDELMEQCEQLEQVLYTHTMLIQEVQPQLQQVWQEQLDRVQRQQQLCRAKVEYCVQLRSDVQLVGSAVKHLRLFAVSLAHTAETFDTRRIQPAVATVAPMEQICRQIGQLEPDSTKRVDAIEKEEQQRRARTAAERQQQLEQVQSLKQKLKQTKDMSDEAVKQHTARKQSRQAQLARLTARERSRGGTDGLFASPLKHKAKRSRSGTRSEQSSSHNTTLDAAQLESDQNSMEDELDRMSLKSPCESPAFGEQPSPSSSTAATTDSDVPTVLDDHKPPSGSSAAAKAKGLQRSNTLNIKQIDAALQSAVVLRERAANQTECGLAGRPDSEPGPSELLPLSSSLPTDAGGFAAPTTQQQLPVQTIRPLSMMQPGTSKPPAVPSAPPAGLWAAFRPGVTVEQSTLNAREQMLNMIKDRVPRIDVGALGSPTPSPERETDNAGEQKKDEQKDTTS